MTKTEIRKIYLQKRLALTEAEHMQLSQRLAENFFSLIDLSSFKVVHTFLPIEKQKEVNTWLIIDRVHKEFPNIRVAVPRINNQSSTIESFYLEGLHQLENNAWGIPEPKQGIFAPAETLDAVLVPLLGFDEQGNRVGYGRGFYDKFLKACPANCQRIGLSFFPPVDRIDDIAPYDLPLDLVVTPEEVLKLS